MFNEATQAKIDQIIERLPQIGKAYFKPGHGLSLNINLSVSPLDDPSPYANLAVSISSVASTADPRWIKDTQQIKVKREPKMPEQTAEATKTVHKEPPRQETPAAPSFTERMKSAASAEEGRAIIREYEEAFASIEKEAGLPHSIGRGGSGCAGRGYSTLTTREKAKIVKDVTAKSKDLGGRLKALIKDIDETEPAWESLLKKEHGARAAGSRDLMEKEIAAKCARKGMTPEKIQGFKDFCARWFQVTGGFDALAQEHLDSIRTDFDTLIGDYYASFPPADDTTKAPPAPEAQQQEDLFPEQKQSEPPKDGPIAARYGINIPEDVNPHGKITTAVAQQIDKIRRERGLEGSALMRHIDFQHDTQKILDIKWGDVPAILYWMETSKPTAN